MSALGDSAASYLKLRRALGFKLVHHGGMLTSLVSYLDERGLETLTAEAALAWVCLPADAGPARWSKRLGVARGFAAYLVSIDPATEVPPARLWPRVERASPGPHRANDRSDTALPRSRLPSRLPRSHLKGAFLCRHLETATQRGGHPHECSSA